MSRRVSAASPALGRLHADGGVAIALDVSPDVRFAGEEADLQETLGNLMDNACKWARGRIRVSARRKGGDALAHAAEDDGPGLPPERRAAVLAPGVRLDETVPGTGLGLAVTDDLARLYGGALLLAEAELGGLKAELRLPAAVG